MTSLVRINLIPIMQYSLMSHIFEKKKTFFSFILFNGLQTFLDEIETDNLTVSNSEVITLDLTVSKPGISWVYLLT